MRLLLIRHGAIDTGGRLCGSFDLPLSPSGVAELTHHTRRLAHAAPPDALFTSPLRRATQVAEALGRVWARQPVPAEWAREIDCGELEGAPLVRVREQFPDLWARNEAQDDDTFAWPGGESYTQFRSRILTGLGVTASVKAGRRLAIVTHAGVISQILGVIRGRPAAVWGVDRPRPLTATEVIWENGAPAAVLTSDDPEWY